MGRRYYEQEVRRRNQRENIRRRNYRQGDTRMRKLAVLGAMPKLAILGSIPKLAVLGAMPKLAVLGGILLGAFVALAHPAAAKTYAIPAVSIEAQLAPDGSMTVTESRTYDFDGSFHFAYRKIPVAQGERYADIQVSEGEKRYELSDSESPGTYSVRTQPDEIEVRWFFRARNESRSFDLHFRVENLVRNYDDAALLYYKFIGADWDRSNNNIKITVQPPAPLSRDDVRVWLHGPLWGEIQILSDGVLRATCEHLPARTFLEIRALYPTGAFPAATQISGPVRARVMDEESRWAEEANRERAAAREKSIAKQARYALGKRYMPFLAVLGVLGGILIYRRYGRRPDYAPAVSMAATAPSDTPPALVGYLLHSRQVGPRDLVATILDLARRGFLTLREEPREERKLFGGKKVATHYIWTFKRDEYEPRRGELLGYEDQLLRFVFDDLAAGADEIDIRDFNEDKRGMRRFYRAWSKNVRTEAEARNYYERESMRGMSLGVLLGIGLVAVSIPLLVLFGPWAAPLLFAGAVNVIIAFFVPHRTPAAETEARTWKALKRYIEQMRHGAPTGADLSSNMSMYLVYGTVLGLSDKVFKSLIGAIPASDAATYVPWYVWTSGGHFAPDSFSAAFSSMVATTTSTVSSAAGAGGGASGGGGGGSGGGGGGAG